MTCEANAAKLGKRAIAALEDVQLVIELEGGRTLHSECNTQHSYGKRFSGLKLWAQH